MVFRSRALPIMATNACVPDGELPPPRIRLPLHISPDCVRCIPLPASDRTPLSHPDSGDYNSLKVATSRASAGVLRPFFLSDPMGDLLFDGTHPPSHTPDNLLRLSRLAVRTRVFDGAFSDFVRDAPAGSRAQAIILGAGQDLRCLRIAPRALSESSCVGVDMYEADLPASISSKLRLVYGAGFDCGTGAHRATAVDLSDVTKSDVRVIYVPCDLALEGWHARLVTAGFDPTRDAVFLAEGLLYYFEPEVARRMLSDVRRHLCPEDSGSVLMASAVSSLGARPGPLPRGPRFLWGSDDPARDATAGAGWAVARAHILGDASGGCRCWREYLEAEGALPEDDGASGSRKTFYVAAHARDGPGAASHSDALSRGTWAEDIVASRAGCAGAVVVICWGAEGSPVGPYAPVPSWGAASRVRRAVQLYRSTIAGADQVGPAIIVLFVGGLDGEGLRMAALAAEAGVPKASILYGDVPLGPFESWRRRVHKSLELLTEGTKLIPEIMFIITSTTRCHRVMDLYRDCTPTAFGASEGGCNYSEDARTVCGTVPYLVSYPDFYATSEGEEFEKFIE